MGVENTKYSENLKKEYFQAIHGMYYVFVTRLLRRWLYYDFIFNWTSLKKIMDINIKTILKLPKMVIKFSYLSMQSLK